MSMSHRKWGLAGWGAPPCAVGRRAARARALSRSVSGQSEVLKCLLFMFLHKTCCDTLETLQARCTDWRQTLCSYMIMPEEAARMSFPSPNCAFSPSLEPTTDVPVCPPCDPCPPPLPLCAASPQPFLAKSARSPALNPCSSSIDIAYVFTVFLTSASPACPRAQHTAVK